MTEPHPCDSDRNDANARFFDRADWLGFALTTALMLGAYLATLAPEVMLDTGGIYVTAAAYAGVPQVPGFPPFTLYAWLFTVLLPFSNFAWRVAVSSAVAGALTCGLIALLASRGSALIVGGITGFLRLDEKEEKILRVISGCVAGMAFGFDGAFWPKAVRADPWPLSLLLLTTTICLLLRWLHMPKSVSRHYPQMRSGWSSSFSLSAPSSLNATRGEQANIASTGGSMRTCPASNQNRYLYLACFVYGLTITNSQALLPAVFGLQFIALLGNPKLGRDLFFVDSLLFAVGFVLTKLDYPSSLLDGYFVPLKTVWAGVSVITAIVSISLAVKTRGLFSEWKTLLFGTLLFLIGTALCFYIVIASMTNPPTNWGYPRTVEGFHHDMARGQFECLHATYSYIQLRHQFLQYGKIAFKEFGLVHVFAALLPFCFLHRMGPQPRRWLFGLFAVYFCLTLFMLIFVCPASDRESHDFVKVYFSASHIILSIWTGSGLVLLGSILAGHPHSARIPFDRAPEL